MEYFTTKHGHIKLVFDSFAYIKDKLGMTKLTGGTAEHV